MMHAPPTNNENENILKGGLDESNPYNESSPYTR
jgi:hypothetical protein